VHQRLAAHAQRGIGAQRLDEERHAQVAGGVETVAGAKDGEARRGDALVLELVEGKTLADRIARGAIPVEDSLKIPKSICKTLEAAHEKGMVHRDFKPANVKIIRAGNVKVRDFGLTKALERNPLQILSNSPTLLSTVAGKFLVRSAGGAMFSAPRHLLFTRNDSLMAQKVNPFYECVP